MEHHNTHTRVRPLIRFFNRVNEDLNEENTNLQPSRHFNAVHFSEIEMRRFYIRVRGYCTDQKDQIDSCDFEALFNNHNLVHACVFVMADTWEIDFGWVESDSYSMELIAALIECICICAGYCGRTVIRGEFKEGIFPGGYDAEGIKNVLELQGFTVKYSNRFYSFSKAIEALELPGVIAGDAEEFRYIKLNDALVFVTRSGVKTGEDEYQYVIASGNDYIKATLYVDENELKVKDGFELHTSNPEMVNAFMQWIVLDNPQLGVSPFTLGWPCSVHDGFIIEALKEFRFETRIENEQLHFSF